MKVKFFAVLLTLCVLMSGCGAEVDKEGVTDTSMFVEVEYAAPWKIVYHKDTKVMYAVSYGAYNYGTFTLLVNADGTPMIWEE